MPSQSHEHLTIRAAVPADAPGIAAIYNHFVAHTVVTFEEEPVSLDEIARRMEDVRSASLPWIVAEEAGRIVGYAYATKWRARAAYRFSTEITVYLGSEDGGRGIGSALYDELFPMLLARGIHAVIGGIALPNDASVALHEKFGMKKVAHFSEVGFKFGKWVDVGFWERTL
jgi:L-amino acid N-acyltransferase YncA